MKPVTRLAFVLVLLMATACSSISKQEKDVMQGQIARIDQRVAVISKSAQAQAELAANLSELQRSVLTMTGQIEEFNTRTQMLSERMEKMERSMGEMSRIYRSEVLEGSAANDLKLEELSTELNILSTDTRAFIELMEANSGISKKTHQRKIDAMGGKRGLAKKSAPAKTSVTQSPDKLYQSSYNFYLKEDFGASINGFETFIKQFPDSSLADNAAYWIGEAYYSQKKYNDAAIAFDDVAESYPQSPKAPAALLKSAYAYQLMKKNNEAIKRFRQVIDSYPTSNEAIQANDLLGKLKPEQQE